MVSLYRHNGVPVPKPQACITPLPWVSRAADLCQLPISAGRTRGVSDPVSRRGDDEPNPFVNTLQPPVTAQLPSSRWSEITVPCPKATQHE